MKLRIAQLANFVGPVSGGMKRAIDQLGRGYLAAGAERILVVPGERDEVIESEAGIEVRVRSPHLPNSAYRMIAQPGHALGVLDRFAPTSIEVSDKWTLSPAAGWARRRGIGAIQFSHERLDGMLGMWLRRQFGVETAVGALNRRLARTFDAVVVTSEYAAAEFANTGARTVRVPLGVDLDTFRPDIASPPDDGQWKLIHAGRMSHEKSPQLAVATGAELWRRGHPVRMDVFGTGPDVDEIRAEAGDAPITFHGYINGREELARRYAQADLSLSVSPVETFGLAVLEALACGTPVVTANRGGARELIDARSGASGDPDPIHLADAVEELLSRDRAATRAAARARAEQFTWSASVDRMLALHTELARRGPYRNQWTDRMRSRRLRGRLRQEDS